MAGIGFQKLNGQGTVAHSQLQELKDINTDLDTTNDQLTQINNDLDTTNSKLAEINSGINDLKNKILTPDLRAWFKILFPTLPVIPFYKTFRMIDPVDATAKQLIGKKVFAEVFMHASLDEVPSTNNTRVGIKVQALLGNTVIHQVSAKVHGNDILVMPSESSSFVGVIDGYWFAKFGSSLLHGDGTIIIRGFVIPDNFNVNELTALDPIPDSIGSDTIVEYLPKTPVMRLNINDIPNGMDFDRADMQGVTDYEIYYVEGSNFLTPGVDYVNKITGGFTLTGFSPLLENQTLLVIF